MPTISGLVVYPVKGCKGIPCNAALLTPSGFLYDRKWVIVDDKGRFISQRKVSKMCLINVTLPQSVLEGQAPEAGAQLQLDAPGMPPLQVPLQLNSDQHNLVPASVWAWQGVGLDEGQAAAEWLTTCLGRPARLVRHVGEVGGMEQLAAGMGSSARRTTGDDDFAAHCPVHFQDQYPCLLGSESSMAALNEAAGGGSHSINRFRANIIVSGSPAWAEDSWRELRVAGGGGVTLLAVKPCTRCNVPDIEQETGAVGREVGRALLQSRNGETTGFAQWHKSFRSATFFGWNLLPTVGGLLRVGDDLEVVVAGGAEPPQRVVADAQA